MRLIVTYDISENKRRGKMHKFLRELGINTQKSVFECDVSVDELNAIQRFGRSCLNLKEDKLRIYHICRHCVEKVEIQGQGIQVTQLEYRIF